MWWDYSGVDSHTFGASRLVLCDSGWGLGLGVLRTQLGTEGDVLHDRYA